METGMNNIPDWRGKEVLIVEDNPFIAEFLVEVLANTGVKTTIVTNGEDAVRLIKTNDDFDVVLMDIRLPGMSGVEATREIRKFDQEIPIIAQTAHAMIHDRVKYIRAGCTDYFIKPVSIENLFAILCNYL
jgi:CheY-like chemotaxis protein